MPFWPFKREVRGGAYTDGLIAQILAQSGSEAVSVAAVGALESVSGIVSRAFSVAAVEAPDGILECLTPATLGGIGRALIRQGECVLSIGVKGPGLVLYPASSWDITGGHEKSTWRYRVTVSGPSSLSTQRAVMSDGVVHCMYSFDHSRPWVGVSALTSAALTGKLSASTLAALSDESGSMMGFMLPVPKDGGSDTLNMLRADLRQSKGKTHLVESMNTGWAADAQGSRPLQDWVRRRYGPEPPEALVSLQDLASREVLQAFGVSPSLFDTKAGAASREAYRQLLHGFIAPLGKLVEEELRAKLDPSVRLNFDSLFAADLQGRARAFQSLVGGGMDITKAAALSGLMAADE